MSRRNKKRIEKCCETCENLIPIGEGDHICYEVEREDGSPCIVPISDYLPTDEYYKCKGYNWEEVQ